ncbi:hypothetical protein FRC04_000903 [Tulasnella sp. 424]|nr:hypothetical protein FRC04_000903 [Tulasnella sp. 424]KAG8977821.1 hypothetical protein FRC05_000348 [Tulasnella sp. 425]
MVDLRIDNNSGFTVIDVTHPFTPAICFWGTDAYPGYPAGYPIAPEDYALRYYVDADEENELEELDQEVQDAIRGLENQPFIDDRMILDEAWSKWIPFLDETEEESLSQGAEKFMAALRTAIEAGSTENAQRMADTLSVTPEIVEGLRHVLHRETLPGHCNSILVRVFSIAQGLSKSDELLDLRWMQLSPIQVLQVAQAVIQNESFKISSLDISGNSAITVETLSEIFRLEKAKEIKRVFLFGCTKVEGLRRGDMPGRIGADEAAEVFNSYFPTSLSEFRPWDIDTGSDDD